MTTPSRKSTRVARRLSWNKKVLFAGLVWLVALLLLYIGSIGWRTYRLYDHFKSGERGWSTAIHQFDHELGYRPRRGISASQLLPLGPPVPVHLDEQGFRVAADSAEQDPPGGPPIPGPPIPGPPIPGPRILALGGSFTFGAACAAEEGFVDQVADRCGGAGWNAGVCGYGLTQMLLRARRLIPKHHPDVVLVQYSPWLVDRALSPYAPSQWCRQPVPYFTQGADGGLEIAPPCFARGRVDPYPYRQTSASFSDFASFLATVSTPLLVHDDILSVSTWLQQQLGLLSQPMDDRQAVVDHVYGELDGLCQRAEAQLVIVILEASFPVRQRDSLRAAEHAIVVDAHAEMVSRMPPLGALVYQKLYCHWRGDPPVLVDHHPNQHAHALIAEEIIKALPERFAGP